MIPSVIGAQVRRGISEFLRTTFPITNPWFANSFDSLLDGEGQRPIPAQCRRQPGDHGLQVAEITQHVGRRDQIEGVGMGRQVVAQFGRNQGIVECPAAGVFQHGR